jgi:hypothetical protein
MVLLEGGQVLSVGGWSGTEAMDLALLYAGGPSPQVTEPGTLLEARVGPLAAALEGGKVLVCNGWREDKGAPVLLRSAEVFNPREGRSSAVPPPEGAADCLRFAHCGGVMGRLADGTVLVAGGDDGGGRDSGAELFDPKTGTFRVLDLAPLPSGASIITLANGRLLMLGGRHQEGPRKGISAQVLSFDPAAHAFTSAGTLRLARMGLATSLLPDGKVLVMGGFVQGKESDDLEATPSCEIFDPQTGTSAAAVPMSEPKAQMAAASMATGQIMVLGGCTGRKSNTLMATTIETYSPWESAWFTFDRPKTGIYRPVLFPLPDGSMFVGGSHVEFDPAKRAEEGVLPLKLVCE